MAETTISAQDRSAIHALMARYAWCLDRGDIDGLAATFTPDGAIHSATTCQVFEGTEGIKEFVANALAQPGFAGRQHHIHPLTIEAMDGGYFAISYWMVVTWDAGKEPRIVALGYYRDTCVQVEGQWRFQKKIIARWDSETAPMVGKTP
jgi:ketosteroid isomerase-like protein